MWFVHVVNILLDFTFTCTGFFPWGKHVPIYPQPLNWSQHPTPWNFRKRKLLYSEKDALHNNHRSNCLSNCLCVSPISNQWWIYCHQRPSGVRHVTLMFWVKVIYRLRQSTKSYLIDVCIMKHQGLIVCCGKFKFWTLLLLFLAFTRRHSRTVNKSTCRFLCFLVAFVNLCSGAVCLPLLCGLATNNSSSVVSTLAFLI